MNEPLETQAAKFFLPPDVHYLNCAFQAPMLQPAEDAVIAALHGLRGPQRLRASDYFDDVERARVLFGRLIGGSADGVALIPGSSYGVAVAARNAAVRAGQNIVVAEGQFPSNVYSWQRLAAENNATLRTVDRPASPDVSWSARILESIDRQTAVVALGTTDWADGTCFDLEAIGARAREVGALFVLDGTQSIGVMKFDASRVKPDLLVCSSYKWLLGPLGLGMCYVGERLRDGVPLEETWLGRANSEDFNSLTEYPHQYQPGARRFDQSGRAQFLLVPMLNAAMTQLLEWGPGRIQDYARRLGAPLAPWIARDTADEVSAHLFAVRAPAGVDADRFHELLRARGVYVSLRRNLLRVSIHMFNTEDDVAALVSCLATSSNAHGRSEVAAVGGLAG